MGTPFVLTAGGFRAGEPMTFEIDLPDKTHFVGPPHSAGADGKVSTTYRPLLTNPPGVYNVRAVGSLGTLAKATVAVQK